MLAACTGLLAFAGPAAANVEAQAAYDQWRTDNLPVIEDAPVTGVPQGYPEIWYDPFAAEFRDFALTAPAHSRYIQPQGAETPDPYNADLANTWDFSHQASINGDADDGN